MWTGSDVLFATKFLKHSKKTKWVYMLGVRIFAKIADKFVEQHYVVSEHLISELKPLNLKKKIGILTDPPLYVKKFKKREHSGFNILYYCAKGSNKPFKDWVYGKDLVNDLLFAYNIIEVDGSQDMSKIYPIVDFYIRPNRHDGNPRMIMECEINDIPYYWSRENPNFNEMVRQIEKAKIQRKS